MTASAVERRLRLYCRLLALAASGGTAVELWLVGHTDGWLQWLPFGMCALVVISLLGIAWRGTRRMLSLHRLLMMLVLAGSAFGVYTHLNHNMTFAREIRPSASSGEIWSAGIRGANPLLAAGALAMTAALGLLGSYGASGSDERTGIVQ